MNLPPITKEQKITLLFTAFAILLFIFFLLWKPTKIIQKDLVQTQTSINKEIDSLENKLKKQIEINVVLVQRISELEKSRDSIKVLIEEKSKKITTIKKRRKDEKKVNYNAWTDNEFTQFLSNRYQQH